MSEISLRIDGREVAARQDMTILEAARKAGLSIPTICHNKKLEPFGGCRLCIVEAETGGRTTLVAACTYPVQKDMVVRTRSKQVDETRKTLTELLLARAPESEVLQNLARDYHADKDRFARQASFCILCGLCVRYCAEVTRKNAVVFVNRGSAREIMFVPEIAARECWDCKECFQLCPTSALQAAYVLVRSLTSPGTGSDKQTNSVPERGRDDGSTDGDTTLRQATAKR